VAQEQKSSIRVLLADDHPLIMAGFAMSLEGFGIEVVGQALTPEDTVKRYQDLLPDVLVLDIRFGEKLTGFDAARSVLSQFRDARIVFLSQFDQDNLIKEAYGLGGRAFVTKNSSPEQLATAIQHVNAGEVYFLPRVAEHLATLAIHGDPSPRSILDPRQLQVFTYMAQGLTNAEMAEKLDLSLKSISNLSQAVKEALGMHRAADITRLAIKHGFFEP
jgi:DNA-binding NarL/FixJ family response regulator